MIWSERGGRQVPVAGALLHVRRIGGPVGDLDIDVEAGFLELLCDDQHGGAHPLIIAIGLDHDLFVVVTRLLQQRLGLCRILDVVPGRRRGIAQKIRRVGKRHPRIAFVDTACAFDDVIDVDRRRDGLPDQHIRGQTSLRVDDNVAAQHREIFMDGEILALRDPFREFAGNAGDQLRFAILQRRDPGRRLRHEPIAHRVEIDRLAAAIAVAGGRAGIRCVVIEPADD